MKAAAVTPRPKVFGSAEEYIEAVVKGEESVDQDRLDAAKLILPRLHPGACIERPSRSPQTDPARNQQLQLLQLHAGIEPRKRKARAIDLDKPPLERFFLEWRSGSLDVPYIPCTTEHLYRLYQRWCKSNGAFVVTLTKLASFVVAQVGITRRRDVHYDYAKSLRKATFLMPREPAQEFARLEGENQSTWLARCLMKFESCIMPASVKKP
jgi:hypothetical protein